MKVYLDQLLARHRVPSHSNGFFPWATSHAPKDSLKTTAPLPPKTRARRRKTDGH